MIHIKRFNSFLNEQEKAGLEDIGSYMKDMVDIFKNSGLASFLGDFSGDGPVGITNMKAPTEAEKLENIKTINIAMDRHEVKDKNLRAAILGIVGNESGFGGGEEESYYGTKIDNIKRIFSTRVEGHENDIDAWRKKGQQEFDKNFWELVYGYQTKVGKDIGNTEAGDGAKYRGRGFHQLTGKGEYKLMQDIYNKYKSSNPDKVKDLPSIDILSNPEQMADPKIGAEICVLYLITGLEHIKSKYPKVTLEGPDDKDEAVRAMSNVNAGLGADMSKPIRTEYIAKAKGYQEDILSKNLT